MRLYIAIAFIFCSNALVAQNFNDAQLKRKITIDNDTAVIKAEVLIEHSANFKINNNLWYCSFANNKINHIQGAIIGQPLEGNYEYFDANNKLIEKGEYLHGLKNGPWKSWDAKGNLISVENYSRGLKNGESIYYDEKGGISESIQFRSGLKHGNQIIASETKTIHIQYRKGEIVKQDTVLNENNN
ncbi:MAG: hypothetical protein RH860_01825 [Cytophagales bacterium]